MGGFGAGSGRAFPTDFGCFPQLAAFASITYYQQVASPWPICTRAARHGKVKRIGSSGKASLKGDSSPVVLKAKRDLFDSRCASGAR